LRKAKAVEIVVRKADVDEVEGAERKRESAEVDRAMTRAQVVEVFEESNGEVLELAHRWCPLAAPLMVARCTCRQVRYYRPKSGGRCRRGCECPARPCCRWKDRRLRMTPKWELRGPGLCRLHGLGQSNRRP